MGFTLQEAQWLVKFYRNLPGGQAAAAEQSGQDAAQAQFSDHDDYVTQAQFSDHDDYGDDYGDYGYSDDQAIGVGYYDDYR